MKHDDKLFGLIAKGGSEKGYHSQESALDTSLNACDGSNSLGFFIWGYEPSNTNELGDLWVRSLPSPPSYFPSCR
jgi:hypothetical protein